MIFITFLYQVLSEKLLIEKTIYLIEGEEYKVNLDSIFHEDQENTYLFQSSDKGFTLDTSSLKLKSDQGTYSTKPTRILRERQLINLEDYQGQGQFGILDQYESGHRICYNDDAEINLDQCIELDNTATSYDFVFISRNTVAVSMIRVADQKFGIRIYKDKQIISESYFVPSKSYSQVKQTIIEYSIFQSKKYLLFAVTEQDSNIEFLEIQDDFQIVNTNKVIDKSLLPEQQALQVYDIKGTLNKIYVVIQSSEQAMLIISFTFYWNKWWLDKEAIIVSQNFRGFELGYSYIKKQVTLTQLECYEAICKVSSNQVDLIFKNLSIKTKPQAQVKYTLNYLIVFQDNCIIVSPLLNGGQRSNTILGTILKIDVDFLNDVLIIFTNTQILTYYLKQVTLSYSSSTITQSLDSVIIQAVSEQYQQIANISFQILSKQDYNIYLTKTLTKDLYYNLLFDSTRFSVPLFGISGADIKVNFEIDNSKIYHEKQTQGRVILEYFIGGAYGCRLIKQFDDFRILIYYNDFPIFKSTINLNGPSNEYYSNQKVTFQSDQEFVTYTWLYSDGLQIQNEFNIIKTSQDKKFVDFKIKRDMLFIYRIDDQIDIHQKGEVIFQLNLSQFGKPQGELIRKLFVNQAKTNLIVITYGEDLIIGRFTTSQFIFIQRITIKWVIDVAIIADNKFIVLSTDRTIQKLTQYILEEGRIRIHRELGTYGYIITGDNILCDSVQGQIIIQAQKGSQKLLLLFGDTELARDSLLQVIPLQHDEFAVNFLYNYNETFLFKRTTDDKKNSSVMGGIYNGYQDIQINFTKIPNQFSQQLNLKYIFSSQFSQNNPLKDQKNLYIEYQFYNITVKYPDNTISYKKNQDQLKVPIKSDTFQGQVKSFKYQINKQDPIPKESDNFNLSTRFTNDKFLIKISGLIQCKQVISFQRILCIGESNLTYHNIDGKTLSQINANISYKSAELILNNDESYALIRSNEQLILIHISQNEIQLGQSQQWNISLNISIFYKEWLVLCKRDQIIYFYFQPQINDLWLIEKQKQILKNIKAIQYDPITEQMIYSTRDSNLYYFKSSLEKNSINHQTEYFCNIPQLLKQYKIYQVDPTIQYIKMITQQNKSYLLVSTSYGNIWNLTIKSLTKDFQINNMYIVNGPRVRNQPWAENWFTPTVYNIQLINDYMLVQNLQYQSLYQTTNDISKPSLALQEIVAPNFVGLFQNGSQIIHIHKYQDVLYQNNILDEVVITINDLRMFPFGVISIVAKNGYGQAKINYQIMEKQSEYFWIFGCIIIFIAIGGFYWYKRNRQRVVVINLIDQEEEVELQ